MQGSVWEKKWDAVDEMNIKAGGQGRVFKVRSKETCQYGALKIFHPESLHQTERRQRIEREVKYLKVVQGTGVPKLLDFYMDASEAFLVTEWIDGVTLSNYVNGKALDLDSSLIIVKRLCNIMARCHSQGVLHRDIKPDNIIICGNSLDVFLVDFGISYFKAEEKKNVTNAGQELGNRFLRLPELSPGGNRRDCRSDITMLVGILFYMLTGITPRNLVDERGQLPHERPNEQLVENILSGLDGRILRRIFNVGFQVDINLRFQKVEELTDSIEEIVSPKDNTGDLVSIDMELERYRDLVESSIAKSWKRIEMVILQLSRDQEKALKGLAESNGLSSRHNSGWAWVSEPGRKVEYTYTLVRREAWKPEVQLWHTIEILGENLSYVECRVKYDYADEHTYYRGMAADLDGIKLAMDSKINELFTETLRRLTDKLASSING